MMTIKCGDKTYTKDDLMEIGSEIASMYGGSCIGFEVLNKDKMVRFHCIEDGEEFYSDVEYADLHEYER